MCAESRGGPRAFPGCEDSPVREHCGGPRRQAGLVGYSPVRRPAVPPGGGPSRRQAFLAATALWQASPGRAAADEFRVNRIRVLVAADRRSAEVQIAPGTPAAPRELRAALRAQNVVHGLDEQALAALDQVLAAADTQVRAVVARATEPTPGCDGRIELAFASAPLPGQQGSDGAVD